jgi:hypothetical protein
LPKVQSPSAAQLVLQASVEAQVSAFGQALLVATEQACELSHVLVVRVALEQVPKSLAEEAPVSLNTRHVGFS